MSNSERGVSDVIAFTLTFAIIISGVGLVSTVALDPITNFTDRQNVINAERGMQASASTIDEIHRGDSTYEQIDIVPSDGDLYVNETYIGISEVGVAGGRIPPGVGPGLTGPGMTPSIASIQTNALEIAYEEETVGYEGGGVYRTDAAGLSYGPAIRCTNSGRSIVSIPVLRPSGDIGSSSGFNPDVVIGPTHIPQSSPVTAANPFATLAITPTNTTVLEIDGLALFFGKTASPENWVQEFEDREEWSSLPSGDYGFECTGDVTLRIVELGLTQIE